MNNKEFTEFLGISEPTLYNWKKEKPNLYKIVMKYKNGNLNNNSEKNNDLLKLFECLSDDEREMYAHEIKARILRKKIDKGLK